MILQALNTLVIDRVVIFSQPRIRLSVRLLHFSQPRYCLRFLGVLTTAVTIVTNNQLC